MGIWILALIKRHHYEWLCTAEYLFTQTPLIKIMCVIIARMHSYLLKKCKYSMMFTNYLNSECEALVGN